MKDIIITRKRIKHYILKISPLGDITLSVPYLSSKKDIDSFILKNKVWLEKHYEGAVDKTLFYGPSYPYIYLLGVKVPLKIKEGNINVVKEEEGTLIIYLKDTSDNKKASSLLEKYLSFKRDEVYKEIVERYSKITKEKVNSLKYRSLKRTSGKCYYEKREIILSKTLIHKDIKYIEAIVLHEIAHLKYHNHSKEFYSYILSFMPDYKERLKHLTNES